MKTLRVGVVFFALTLLAGAPALAQTGPDLLQQALVMEQAEGNLQTAIQLYERIVQEFGGDRPLAARALVQIGKCYEKLGSQEAERAYRRVVSDYADQSEHVEEARVRLAILSQPPQRAESTIQARLLMAGLYGDVEFNGGPTPDGQNLVYIDWESGNLAIRDLVSGEVRMLTDDGYDPGYPLQAQVSPNGKWVAYTWAQNEPYRMELRIVGLDGSSLRTLQSAHDVRSPAWSKDGRHLAAKFHHESNSDTEVAWVSVEDGSKTSLATFPQGLGPGISHSPDDRFLSVVVPGEEDSAGSDIFLVATDGSGVQPFIDHPADDWLIGWVPGTDEFLFSSDRSGERDLWAIRVDPDGDAEGLRPVSRGIAELNPMGFTEDGSLFYYNYTLQRNTAIAPFDQTTGTIALDQAEPILGVGSNQRPSWSPDGEYLAYVQRPRGKEEVLHVLKLGNGEDRSLAEGITPATTGAPTWFPNGRGLLVLGKQKVAAPEDVPPAVYRVDLVSGEAHQLFEIPSPTVGVGHWWGAVGLLASGDGEDVILVHDGRLYRYDLQSGQEEDLFLHPDLAAEVLALSPDGLELAFGIGDPNAVYPQIRLNPGGRIMVIPAGGGEAREILELQEPCTATDVAWSSDGRYLFFQQRDEEGIAIMRVPREGGEAERMWEAPERMFAWAPSPDGRQVAFWIEENEAEIWVMENLVAALRESGGGQ